MKLNGTRLEKRSTRKITNFQARNGDYLEVKWRINTKTTTRKKQAGKILSTKTQEYSPFSENNQAFYSTAEFSLHFTTVSERKIHFKKENPTFCCAGVK